MTWYTASLITAIFTSDRKDEPIFVFEDFVLIEADSHVIADSIAHEIGDKRANIDDKLCIDGKSANRQFLGVRKIRSIYNDSSDIDERPPSRGTELSHSFFRVASLEVAKEMAKGACVTVEYVDDSIETR